MLGHHRSDGSKLVGEFKYTAWNSKFYDKNAAGEEILPAESLNQI